MVSYRCAHDYYTKIIVLFFPMRVLGCLSFGESEEHVLQEDDSCRHPCWRFTANANARISCDGDVVTDVLRAKVSL